MKALPFKYRVAFALAGVLLMIAGIECEAEPNRWLWTLGFASIVFAIVQAFINLITEWRR